MTRRTPELFAAVHLGSEQVSLQIVEYKTLEDRKIIEKAHRQVSLGEETFKTGKISFSATAEVCELLKGYRRTLSEYGVRDFRIMATTAVREAQNQQYIIDQIKIKTGFDVEVLDMPQEIFLKYIALYRTVAGHGLANPLDGLLFVDISSGGLGITLLKGGAIKYQQNIHIGALRIKESFEKHQRESAYFHEALSEYIFSTIDSVEHEIGKEKIKYLVLSGIETRLLLKMLGREQNDRLEFVNLEDFYKLYQQVKGLNLPQIMAAFDLTESRAEMVLPTIVLYKQILALTTVEHIVIPSDQLIDGFVLKHIAEKTKDSLLDVMDNQIVSLVREIARKYNHDTKHAGAVEKYSLLLFDRLVKIHGLGKRARFLLKIACMLHDIGKYVSLRKHYFYSYRLIVSTDIFGFSEEEKAVIANIAHYHSKGTPSNNDNNYAVLGKEQKVTVAKLAAIIRLADAIDRSHRQKVSDCEIVLRGNELHVFASAKEDISLEEWTFADKTDFFQDVYGIRPILFRRVG
ncbi:MAG: HD domain-containing protein [Negativicutes bacterium]|nr:HD domain-containing protein [Negativicutes bacterium]